MSKGRKYLRFLRRLSLVNQLEEGFSVSHGPGMSPKSDFPLLGLRSEKKGQDEKVMGCLLNDS